MQRLDQRHHVQNRHSVAQHARNQLCIVPEFLVEQAGNTADGIRIAILVGVLEIVTLVAVGILNLQDNSLGHLFRNEHRVLFELTGKNLVRTIVVDSHKGDPVLFAVLEPHDIGGQFHRTFQRRLVFPAVILTVFFLLDQHSGTRPVPVYGNALATGLPGGLIHLAHQLFGHAVGQVYGHRDRVVDPFLDRALHLHLAHPVDIVGRSFVIR